MNAPVGNFRLKTTVWSSGASMLSTMRYWGLRWLTIPSAGKTILSKVALMSCAVRGVPSWNSTPSRIVKV